MSRGKWIMTISLLAIVLVLSIIKYTNYRKTEAKLQQVVKPGGKGGKMSVTGFVTSYVNLPRQISTNGTIIAGDEVQLQPEVAGRITYLNIKEGDFVQKGTLLAKLNDSELQAQLKKLIAQHNIAKLNEQRLSDLIKTNGISQQEYDASLNALNNINADIELIQAQIAKTEIRAPFNGRMGLRNISVGAFVTTSTIISTLQDLSVLKIDMAIPEKYANIIKTDNQMQCKIDGSTSLFNAKVLAIDARIDENTRNFMVRALIQQPNNTQLIPGAYVKVDIVLASIPNSILIPGNAIIPDAKNKKVILADHGHAKFVLVETGIRTNNEIEILRGLKVGDTIVTSGILQVKPNTGLKFTKVTFKTTE